MTRSAIRWDTPPESLDVIAQELRALRQQAGAPSFTEIMQRARAVRAARGLPEHEQAIARSTVYDCFRDGRRRVDPDAVADVAAALGLPANQRRAWLQRVSAARAAADNSLIAVAQQAAPEPVPNFAGREREIQVLQDAVREPQARVWVSGMGGMGKTQLSLQLARAHKGPLLFLDLRGFTSEAPAVDAPAAQRTILRSLGAREQLPVDAAERQRRVQSVLASSAALLILDDAADHAHVSDILGDEPVGRVLVTSRSLAPSGGWHHIALRGLSQHETGEVLEPYRGERPAAPAELERLSGLFDGLPLATSLVAGRITTHPEWTLDEHLDLMTERMDSARLEDELRVSLELSYAALPATAAQLLRSFADVPLAEISADGAAAVLDCDLDDAVEALDQLTARSLAVPREHGAASMHSLIRAFAREKALEIDPPSRRRACFGRVALYAAKTLWAAYETIADELGDSVRRTNFTWTSRNWSSAEATEWLQHNLSGLLALAHSAAGRGHPELLYRISEGLSWWLNMQAFFTDALRLHEAAAELAASEGDADALAMASLDTGQLLMQGDRLDDALAHFQRATSLVGDASELGDPGLPGLLLNMSAMIQLRHGLYADAEAALHRAAEIHERNREDARLLGALTNLSIVLFESGQFAEEREVLDRALRLARDTEHDLFVANLLVNESVLQHTVGEHARALETADAALELADRWGIRYLVVMADLAAGEALRALNEFAPSRVRLERALAEARRIGASQTISEALVAAARLSAAEGDTAAVERELKEAESLLAESGDDRARGHIWLLRAEVTGATASLEKALEHFESAGSYEVADVQRMLAERA